MVVTEVKIKLVPKSDDKLLAFASVTFDRCFVVRDIKIIQGTKSLFVAMPSRKITDRCPKCSAKNHLQAQFCNQCGTKLPQNRSRSDDRGRAKLHADIAHPINVKCRSDIQDAILKGYQQEVERSRLPGYVPPTFDEFDAGPEDDGSTPQATPLGTPAVKGGTPQFGTPAVTPGKGLPAVTDKPPQTETGERKDEKRPDGGGFGVFSS
jgi:stage V sporulation protein G